MSLACLGTTPVWAGEFQTTEQQTNLITVQTADQTATDSSFEIKKGVLTKYEGSDEEVVIPKGIETIAPTAFAECKTMTSIHMPSTVKKIGSNAFFFCDALKEITISKNVTAINANTFCGCSNLTSVTIPKKVKKIGDTAFMNCINLKEISIPAKVTSFGTDVFGECKNLTILGSKGSYAQKYAKKHKLAFSVQK